MQPYLRTRLALVPRPGGEGAEQSKGARRSPMVGRWAAEMALKRSFRWPSVEVEDKAALFGAWQRTWSRRGGGVLLRASGQQQVTGQVQGLPRAPFPPPWGRRPRGTKGITWGIRGNEPQVRLHSSEHRARAPANFLWLLNPLKELALTKKKKKKETQQKTVD